MEVLEAILWLILLIMNWRILLCVSFAAFCAILLVSIAPDQAWPWIVGSALVVTAIAAGLVWEWRSDAGDF